MCIVCSVTSSEVISRLLAAGWVEMAQKGSHKQFKHPQRKGRVTVPYPKKDLPMGTIKSIEKQSGLSLR